MKIDKSKHTVAVPLDEYNWLISNSDPEVLAKITGLLLDFCFHKAQNPVNLMGFAGRGVSEGQQAVMAVFSDLKAYSIRCGFELKISTDPDNLRGTVGGGFIITGIETIKKQEQ